ncbi:MAG: hypothetical protein KGN34_12295 [Sphingomonadales bacterium]|nr:hypothetical protein [Sphingomonadales bacterium]
MKETFLGFDSNAWLAIVGGIYAFATLLLAWWTNLASRRAVQVAREVARNQIEASSKIASEQLEASSKSVADQIAASTLAAREQIEASAKGVADQIAASSEAQELQLKAMRDAAIIQARASSVSNNRQAWINALRDEVTGFLTDADMVSVVRDEMPLSDERTREQFRSSRALTSHIFKVRLLINPTEGESTRLVDMLQEAQREGLSPQRREEIVSHLQTILKTEWERVKSGD